MSMIQNFMDNNDNNDKCWPFLNSNINKPEIIQRAKFGTFYSIPLAHSLSTAATPPLSLRLGESQTYRQSASLGQLSITGRSQRGKNNDDTDDDATTSNVLCWYRFKVWWIRPTVINVHSRSNNNIIPPETIALLFQDNNDDTVRYRFIMPCSSCSLRSVTAADDGKSIMLVSSDPSSMSCIMYCGVGSDPYALIHEGLLGHGKLAATATSGRDGIDISSSLSSTPRQNDIIQTTKKKKASFLNGLGWCSWNAFYTQISGTKLVQAVHDLTTSRSSSDKNQDSNSSTKDDNDDAIAATTMIPMRWIIIDNGWQQTTNDAAENGQQWSERLAGWKESCTKFNTNPENNNNNEQLSLKEAITKIKHAARIEDVWVWHTLMGYWLGVDPNFFSDSKLYYPHFSTGIMDNDKSATDEASVTKGIGIPTNAEEFFDTYHAYLKSCGVTGVKVDAQGVVGCLRPYGYDNNDNNDSALASNNNDLVINLHHGLAKSVHKHFIQQQPCDDTDNGEIPAGAAAAAVASSPPIIHCMAHSPKIFHNLRALYDNNHDSSSTSISRNSLPLFRASDDHYPNNPYSHGSHIVACAYNSLLFSHVAIPDWDMFTTQMNHERMVQLHAVARCLSGGPIYLSDPPQPSTAEPNCKNSDIIRNHFIDWICCKDGTTLPCRKTALPIASCLLMDPLAVNGKPLVIFNTNGAAACDNDNDSSAGITSGVLGVFHLAASGRWDPDALDYMPEPAQRQPPQTQSVVLRPMDIPSFCQSSSLLLPASGGGGGNIRKFLAVPFFNSQHTTVLESFSDELILQLEPLQCDAAAIIPILECNVVGGNDPTMSCHYEIAVLGFAGKINGAGAVLHNQVHHEQDGSSTVQLKVQGCGTFLVAVRNTHPSNKLSALHVKVQVNGLSISHDTWYAANSTTPTSSSSFEEQQQKQRSSTKIPDGVLKTGFDVITIEIEETGIFGEEQDISVHLSNTSY